MRSSPIALAAALAIAAPLLGQATRHTVFVVNQLPESTTDTGFGTVVSMTLGADDRLTIVDSDVIQNYSESAAISTDGRLLAVAGGGTGTLQDLFVYRVEPDSSLTRVVTTTTPGAPLDMEWLGPDLLAVTKTDFTAGSEVYVYRIDETLGTKTTVARQRTGQFTSTLGFRPGHAFLYSSDSWSANTITRWLVGPGGSLTHFETVSNFDYALDLTLTPDLRFLYAGGGASPSGNHFISCYDITDDEALIYHFLNPFFSPGDSPAYLEASDNGYLFVGHGGDATIRSFHIETDGSLVDTNFEFDVGLQGTIGNMAVMGDYLFVTDDSTAIDGVSGIYTFRIETNGSLTMTGPIQPTGGRRAEGGMAVWPGTGVCPCDPDGNVADVFDLLAYLDDWFALAPAADLDGSGGVDVFDLLTFLDCWFPAAAGGPC